MEIINKTHFDVGAINDYTGICESCASPLEYDGQLLVVHMEETEKERIFVPIDILVCPECGKKIERIILHKMLDITEELKEIQK